MTSSALTYGTILGQDACRVVHIRIKLLLLPTAKSISYSDIMSFSYFLYFLFEDSLTVYFFIEICTLTLAQAPPSRERQSLFKHDLILTSVAERVGFEPTKEGSLSVFKTDSISHSDTPPCCRTKMCGGDISMINTICVEMRSRLKLQAEGHRCRYWIDT